MQHGQAVAEEIDPDRPLTDRGRTEVRRVAQAAAEHRVTVRTVCHSGKRRAVETAVILAEEVALGRIPEKMAGLAPKDDPRWTAQAVEAMKEPVALVGHMPHLSRLVSILVVGDPDREILSLRQGGLVKLVRNGEWRVVWILVPELTG